jgi:poly(A) polymerase
MDSILQQSFADHPCSQFLAAFNQIARVLGSRLFLVGGSIRNALLSIPFHEVDLLLEGNLQEFLEAVSTSPNMTIVLLDKKRNLYRLVSKPKKIYFDLSPCEEMTVEANLLKRDFPINAIALDLENLLNQTFELLDPQHGVEDLQKKQIRTLNPERFQEDPLRILRGFRLAAALHFSLEEKTEQFAQATAPLLQSISIERIRDEFFKILESEKSYPWILKMDKLGILEILFPEILPLKKTEQNPRYHSYNVWDHSLKTVEELEKLLKEKNYSESQDNLSGERTRLSGLKFAALFHDIGKPSAFTRGENGEIHFYQHETIGENLIQALSERLRLSVKETQFFSLLIRNHLRPAQLARTPKITESAVSRLFRDVHPYEKELILLSLADARAKGKEETPSSAQGKILAAIELLNHAFPQHQSDDQKNSSMGKTFFA